MNELENLIKRYPCLSECAQSIQTAYSILHSCFSSGHKVLVAGNGGSFADSEHIVGELMKSFRLKRGCPPEFIQALNAIDIERGDVLGRNLQRGLPAISLGCHTALNTAFINDVENGGELFFAQQIYVLAKPGDVFLGISTSGNSKNILYAATTAKAMNVKVIGLTGKNGGSLANTADITIKAPETETYKIQELHLPIYHALCLALEEDFFAN